MSHCALGIDGQTVIDSPLLTEKLGINRTEKVHIPENKPYIFMRGNGKGKTAIVWSQSSEDNVASATFKVEAHDFIAFGISFKVNSLYILKTLQPYAGKEELGTYGGCVYLAKPISGSRQSGILSLRILQYSTLSSIAKVDITTIVVTFKGQLISYLAVADRSSMESEGEMSGFIFIKGKVYDIGGVYLGRAKGPYSRVIFAETYLSMTIVPEG
ncbi:hypothetical protein JHK84_042534 [Glycine max]|nr:hypothetical protein JHK84_042534 [Glycine max]